MLLAGTGLFSASVVAAQELPPGDMIIVTAPLSSGRKTPDQLVLGVDEIDERQPQSIADIVAGVAGISLRQNSRGETVLRIRSGEERQTAIFLDGAPLATPWDGRVDLGILPAGILREVSITRSAAPIEYGANAIAGVVDLRTAARGEGAWLRGQIIAGTGSPVDLSAAVLTELGEASDIVLGVTYRLRDFDTIASRSAIPFESGTNDRRLNTDMRSASLFTAFTHRSERGQIRFSLLHADASRGIPFEGHLDPESSQPRYWRYPLWRLTQGSVSGSLELGSHTVLRGTAWLQGFAQDIDSYPDAQFNQAEARESGRDLTVGTRLSLAFPVGSVIGRLVASGQTSTHRQLDGDPGISWEQGSAAGQVQLFRQELLSAGAEFDVPITAKLALTGGLGIDHSATPRTGDKPDQPGVSAPAFSAILGWDAGDALTIKASLARRTRFATMRELFGQALGRFLPNPDLRPEHLDSAELSVDWREDEVISGTVALWLNDSQDTLGQRIVAVGGRRLRQRYNQPGALTYGAEASLGIAFTDTLRAEVSGALQGGHPRAELANPSPHLLQQATRQFAAALDWSPVSVFDIRLEYRHQGGAFDLLPDGSSARLPSSDVFDAKVFWTVARPRPDTQLIALAGIDNIGDALTLPQFGLPDPGRTIRIGLRLVR